MSNYFDKREALYRRFFAEGLPYQEYLKTGSQSEQDKWRRFEEVISLSPAQKNLIASFRRKMPVLVLSGIWCGDCARQGPMLNFIVKSSNCLELRFIENKMNPELQEELRVCGAERVPVVAALSEDFYEVARFGDRHLSVYRKKLALEMGASCDPGIVSGPNNDLITETQEWLDFFERAQLLLRLAPALRRKYGD